MATIVTRAGKGTPLSNAELDANFNNLNNELATKDASGGYPGLTLFTINFKNAANTFTSYLANTNTASRTYTFQDKDMTVAATNDTTYVGTTAISLSRASAAQALTGITSIDGSAASLTTPRNINGVAFNGTSDITVTAAAGTLTGTTLNATVVSSSLTSVGTLVGGTWQATVIGSTYGGTGVNNAGRTLTISTNSGTIAFGAATKTLTVNNTLAFSGTDGSTLNIGTGGTLGTAAYTASTAYLSSATNSTQDGYFTGVRLLETVGATYYLRLVAGSDLTLARTLTITTGDADRTLTINASTTLGGGSHSGTNTGDQTSVSGSAGSVVNSVTFNSGGAGGASGSTFNGASALTVSYNTIGASPTAGSASITTVGTIASGTWQGGIISSTYGGTGVNNGGRTLTINTSNGTISFTTAVTLTVAATASVSGTNTGDNAANSSSTYIGTTAVALNRTSAALSLTGIDGIDSSATSVNLFGTATTKVWGSYNRIQRFTSTVAATTTKNALLFTFAAATAYSFRFKVTLSVYNSNSGVSSINSAVVEGSLSQNTSNTITLAGAHGFVPSSSLTLDVGYSTGTNLFSIDFTTASSAGNNVFNLTVELEGQTLLPIANVTWGTTAAGTFTQLPYEITNTGFYLPSGDAYYINGTSVLNATTLGSGVTGSSLTSVGTLSSGTWQAGIISSTYGGTGVNNAGRTLTINTNSGTISFSSASLTLTVAAAASVSGTNTGDQTSVSGSAGSVVNSVTFNNSGSGGASGSTFNGASALTVSYNTVGASPLAGSSSLTTTGTVSSGTWSASFGAVSGANLTNLTAGNLSGTIPSAVLGNSSYYIGTTAVALNRGSGQLTAYGLNPISPQLRITSAGSYVTNNSFDRGDEIEFINPEWDTAQLQAVFNNNSNVTWYVDSTAPGGYAVQINGSVSIEYSSGFPLIPIGSDGNTEAFLMECWIKNSDAGGQSHYMGSIEWDHNLTGIGGNPGSYGYFVMSNYNPGSTWTRVWGYISGFHATTVGYFKTGAKYFKPQALFNYTAGTGARICHISGWKVYRLGKKYAGKFAASTSNSTEAWYGRAHDRAIGTFTVQLGGSSNSSTFEVVDYAWTTVVLAAGMNTLTYKGSNILHASNYTSYSPSLTGSGASGTWSITVTGGSAYASGASSYVYRSGVDSAPAVVINSDGAYYGHLAARRTTQQWGWGYGSGVGASTNFMFFYDAGSYNYAVKSLVMASGAYLYPGRSDAGDYQTSYYLYSNSAYGLQTNTSFRAEGLYDGGNRVYSGSSRPTTLSGYGITDGVATTYNSTLNTDTRNSRGPTRLFRYDSDSDYSLQHYWTGSYWYLRGFNGDTFHAGVQVAYADSAGSAPANGGTSSAVTMNASAAASTYNMVWHSGNTLYYATGGSGIYCNPSTAYVYANSFVTNGDWFRSVNQTGWYNGTYSAGIYATATQLIETYNSSAFRVNNYLRVNSYIYSDQNYGIGMVGLYSSTRFQQIYAMGDSYKIAADGTSVTGAYGLLWSYPSAGGIAGNLDSHGIIVCINGGMGSAMSTSIVAAGNVTAYSDERLKTDWAILPGDFVKRLALVKNGTYSRIDKNVEGMRQVGVSAQSLMNLMPEAVTIAKDEMGTLQVSYGNAALAACVELAKATVTIQDELELLRIRVAELESRI